MIEANEFTWRGRACGQRLEVDRQPQPKPSWGRGPIQHIAARMDDAREGEAGEQIGGQPRIAGCQLSLPGDHYERWMFTAGARDLGVRPAV